MLEFLWFVGYCREFPSKLGSRVSGSDGWMRHIMYRAIKEGYVIERRIVRDKRVIHSLRLSDKGIDYIGKRDPASLSTILAKWESASTAAHSSTDQIIRLHALATAIVMAHAAGAQILPGKKPALTKDNQASGLYPEYDMEQTYFYSIQELREAVLSTAPSYAAKSTRCLGIILHGIRCYYLYYTGHSRMYWLKAVEDNSCGVIEVLLERLGLPCTVFSQVLIGTNMNVAVKIAKYSYGQKYCQRRFFHVSDDYNNCYYILNNREGDMLLSLIIHPEQQAELNARVLRNYTPSNAARGFDAVTKDGRHPIILSYPFDLQAIVNTENCIVGFREGTILLCFDYQQDALQAIVGPMVEVRSIPEEILREKAK